MKSEKNENSEKNNFFKYSKSFEQSQVNNLEWLLKSKKIIKVNVNPLKEKNIFFWVAINLHQF